MQASRLNAALGQAQTWQRMAAVALVIGAAWLWLTRPPEGVLSAVAAPRIGAPAPTFTTSTPEGEPLALTDLRGQVVVLNIWATWCPPCRAEMPALEAVWTRYREDGLTVVGLNNGESAGQVAAFRDEFALTFPLALDEDGAIGRAYLLTAYPTTVFIGRDGVIRDIVYGGPMSEALIESRVLALLGEE